MNHNFECTLNEEIEKLQTLVSLKLAGQVDGRTMKAIYDGLSNHKTFIDTVVDELTRQIKSPDNQRPPKDDEPRR